ncbi:MAG: hypothetical protein ACI8QS_001991 [Planctomycetota bacterium]|jgi:hypothetical protein
MKSITSLLLVPALFLTPACSGDVDASDIKDGVMEAGSNVLESIGDIDLSSLNLDQVKEKFSGATASMTEGLSGIKDLATAQNFADTFGPLMEKMGAMKDLLGDKMPDMSSLGGMVSGLTEKFSGDDSIMAVLKPILEKVTALVQ